MSEDVLETLRISLLDGKPLVLVLMPSGRFGDLGPKGLPGDTFSPDLSVEEYRAQYEPELSPTRIRELCVGGAFPDAVGPSGEVTPGVYKTSGGEWRITLAGIVERQRQERVNGIERRDREAELRKEKNVAAESRSSKEDRDGLDQDDEVETDGGGPSTEGPRSVDRPGKDRWMAVLAERGEP